MQRNTSDARILHPISDDLQIVILTIGSYSTARSDKISRPFIYASNAYHAVEGSTIDLNCTVSINHGDVVFINWKYPNKDLEAVSIHFEKSKIGNLEPLCLKMQILIFCFPSTVDN